MVKTFEKFINESYYDEDEGYKLTIVVLDKEGKESTEYVKQTFETMFDARKYMNDFMDNNPGCSIEYFDICSGEYNSDPEFLEIWGGKGGTFYDVVYSGLCHRISKGDVYLQINSEIKYLSIKSGNTDSMHFESIVSFIWFFRKLGVSEKTQKILLLFHYGDGTLDGTGSRRMLFEELYIKYKYLIEFASKELNSKEIVSPAYRRNIDRKYKEKQDIFIIDSVMASID